MFINKTATSEIKNGKNFMSNTNRINEQSSDFITGSNTFYQTKNNQYLVEYTQQDEEEPSAFTNANKKNKNCHEDKIVTKQI